MAFYRTPLALILGQRVKSVSPWSQQRLLHAYCAVTSSFHHAYWTSSHKTPTQHSHIGRQIRFKSDGSATHSPQSRDTSASKTYSFQDLSQFSRTPSSGRIIIDVREPSELQSTGHIPGAKNMPVSSSPDGFFLPAEDFEEKFGWPKPKSSDELVFYCKAGVRSRAAAGIAKMAGWSKVSEYPGSWVDWVEKGGKIERS